jgi:adenylyltransferase/sulfurtransferase
MTMTIIPGQTACLKCAFPGLNSSVELATCETAGIVGTVPAIIGSLQATEAIKILVGDKGISRGLLFIDVWENDFLRLTVEPRDDCPACHGKYEALEAQFEIKTTSLCGQTRAVQVLNARATAIDFRELASRLEKMGPVSSNEFVLRFNVQDKEIIVFPDGRAIVQGTIDETLAKELYLRYIFSDSPYPSRQKP